MGAPRRESYHPTLPPVARRRITRQVQSARDRGKTMATWSALRQGVRFLCIQGPRHLPGGRPVWQMVLDGYRDCKRRQNRPCRLARAGRGTLALDWTSEDNFSTRAVSRESVLCANHIDKIPNESCGAGWLEQLNLRSGSTREALIMRSHDQTRPAGWPEPPGRLLTRPCELLINLDEI